MCATISHTSGEPFHTHASRPFVARKNLDGSGRIDYTEFIAATLRQAGMVSETCDMQCACRATAPGQKQYLQKEVLWSAFRVFDKDGTGKITKQELGAILKEQADGEAGVDQMSILFLRHGGCVAYSSGRVALRSRWQRELSMVETLHVAKRVN